MANPAGNGIVRPSVLWFLLLDGGVVVLTKLVVSQTSYDRLNELSGETLPPRKSLRALLAATAVIHAAEALVAGRVAKSRGLAPGPWRRQTLLVGFPSLLALRKAGKGQ